MLIRGASFLDGTIADVRIAGNRIDAIGALPAHGAERVFEARGKLLLPGLHDHHIHLPALAALAVSVQCGPPHVNDADGLTMALRRPGTGWLRGVGYHDSVAGPIDAALLDRIASDRPIRVQHRGGRAWFLNSHAIDLLLADHAPPPGLERIDGRYTGRLFESDVWLRAALAGHPPSFAALGPMLAARGITGVTELTPANDAVIARHVAAERAIGHLPQRVLLGGSPTLRLKDVADGMALGPVKIHLLEEELPSFDAFVAVIRQAHHDDRGVAVHCVTEVELVFALAVFSDAGVRHGDRIEHAAIAPDSAVADIARLGLAVVTQPHFIRERGDAYRSDLPCEDQRVLYRLRGFAEAGVTIAGGSDAPFGRVDPWASMAAAVSRTTSAGITIGEDEALTPEQAIALYLADLDALDRPRRAAVGSVADLCLLDRAWANARTDLASVAVQATWIDGIIVHDRVDQAPA